MLVWNPRAQPRPRCQLLRTTFPQHYFSSNIDSTTVIEVVRRKEFGGYSSYTLLEVPRNDTYFSPIFLSKDTEHSGNNGQALVCIQPKPSTRIDSLQLTFYPIERTNARNVKYTGVNSTGNSPSKREGWMIRFQPSISLLPVHWVRIMPLSVQM